MVMTELKEMVNKAKEKLGDRQADIIASVLNVDKYDSKSMKGCCPVHQENTPSFIWNKKGNYFKCFGCGTTIDIIDAYERTGMSYLEACEELFKEADLDCPIAEKGVKTKKEYKYPHPEKELGGDDSKVRQYLRLRKISDKVMDDAKIGEDDKGNVVFNFYDTNDVLTMVKYRPARKVDKSKGEIKAWCQKDADTSPILFHMGRINPEQPLVITEGEIDCLAVMTAGIYNVVSVPLGSQNMHWIDECFDWLEQFNSIIICGDNDEPGIKMRKDAISRLGSWRCKYVKIPSVIEDETGKHSIKDANEALFYGGAEYLRNLITNADDAEVSSVVNVSDIEDIDLSDIDGVETGIEELDHSIMRLFYGTLTVVSGKPGSGKTSFLSQLVCQSIDQGITPFFFSREMPNYLQKNWIYSVMAGPGNMERHMTNNGTEYFTVMDDAKREIGNYYSKKMFLYRDDASNKLEDVLVSMESCKRRYGCGLFILDNLMTLDLGGDANSELKKQTECINQLIAFAIKWKVAIVLVAHPRKMQASAEVSMDDISGTANIINLAHRTFALRRIDQEHEHSNYNVKLSIIKDRLFGRSGKQIDMFYDVASRRFFTNKKEYTHHYNWESACGRTLVDMECEVLKLSSEEAEVFGESNKKELF